MNGQISQFPLFVSNGNIRNGHSGTCLKFINKYLSNTNQPLFMDLPSSKLHSTTPDNIPIVLSPILHTRKGFR